MVNSNSPGSASFVTCGQCRFCDMTAALPVCRVEPPILVDGHYRHPQVTLEGWCGQGALRLVPAPTKSAVFEPPTNPPVRIFPHRTLPNMEVFEGLPRLYSGPYEGFDESTCDGVPTSDPAA